ncbi:MAG TPA: hypothetical protein VKK31_12420 [Thermoanaerobaculia bacterium]|nr:hypothetical protein [Thermoanaerobaculia bacterium]
MIESWVLIPVAAILAGVVSDWLKVRSKQKLLGVSTSELEREVAALQKEREAVLDRLQNLEAIVVSQTWDAIHDKALPPPARELRVASTVRREVAATDAEAANRQRAEQLARRLQG